MERWHKLIWPILRPLVSLFVFFKFGYRAEKAEGLPGNYIVLANHSTDFDPLFVAASFPRQMYFVASEHISRWKRAYPIIKFLVAPILRYKGTAATATVAEILRKGKGGHNVCIFAEGNRTWDGVTRPILPSTGKLVQRAACGLVTYKIEGGYFVSPRWSEGGTRRGPVRGHVVGVYTKEQLAAMTADQVNELIRADLYEDAYRRQMADPKPYKAKEPARRMESLLFICPHCGGHETFRSHKDTMTCESCGFSFTYDQYGMLHGAPVATVRELAAWQREQVAKDAADGAVYSVPSATLTVVKGHEATLVDSGLLTLSARQLQCGGTVIPLADMSDPDLHGRYALVFSAGKTYYEVRPADKANTLKFLLLFQAYKAQSVKERTG